MWRLLTVVAAVAAAVGSTTVLASAGGGRDDDRGGLKAGHLGVPDIVLYDGKISTVDKNNSTVEAIAIRDGEIMATGSSKSVKKLAKRSTEVVDLNGRRVVPGLIDGHLHGMREGYNCWTQQVRLDLVTKRATALAMYTAKADELADGKWIWTNAGGWHIGQLDDQTPFTFAELTAVAPKNPLWVQGAAPGGGAGFTGPRVNQAALDALGLAPGSPGVQLGPDGKPTGVISGAASTLANATIRAQNDTLGIEGEADCLEDFIAEANSRGLTGGAITDGNHVEEGTMHLYRSKGLNARIAYNAMSSYAGFEQELEDTRNAVGFLGDDMFRYLGPGEDMMPDDPDYNDFTRHSAAKRLSVETHIGALNPLLDGFEAANEVYPIGKLKWKIAHPNAGEPTDEQIARADALNVGWSLTTLPVRNGGPGPRYRSVMEKADHMCLGSDAMNGSPWAPFQRMWYIISGNTMRPGVAGVPAEQRLSRTEMLRHETVECGWFMDQDGRLGSLQPGWHADLIVLDKDYFTVPVDQIKDLRSDLTIVDGRIVHADGAFKHLD